MSEEKKIIELNDEGLEKVNGGYEIKEIDNKYYKIFKAGDCFQYSTTKVKVRHDYQIPVNEPQNVKIYMTNTSTGITNERSPYSDWIVFNDEYYVGNNVW